MPRPTIINKFGTLIGWNNVTVNLFGRELEGITAVSYSDEQEMNVAYGRGAYPQGVEVKNYSAEASITLRIEEVIAIQQSIGRTARFQEIKPFDVVVSYEYNSQVYSDVLRNCRFKTNGKEVAQGDGSIATEFELLLTHIDYNT